MKVCTKMRTHATSFPQRQTPDRFIELVDPESASGGFPMIHFMFQDIKEVQLVCPGIPDRTWNVTGCQ